MVKRLAVVLALIAGAAVLIPAAAGAKTARRARHTACSTGTRRTARKRGSTKTRCVSHAKVKTAAAHAAAARKRRPAPKPSVKAPKEPRPATPTVSPTPAPTTVSPTPAPTTVGSTPAPTTTVSSTPAPVVSSPGAQSWSAVADHVPTWAYDDGCNGGSGAGSGLVQAWLSFAYANCGPGGGAKPLADCHAGGVVACDVIQYLDTNWIYQQGSPPWASFSADASESWYQHVPGSSTQRIQTSGYGGGYVINQSNPAVQSFFQSYVRTNDNADDGLMMDDEGSSLSQELYYASCGCSETNEITSNSALVSAHEAMGAAMTHSDGQPFVQIDNALSPNPYLPTPFGMLDATTGVTGLVSEGVPESDGTLTPYYATFLDEIAYVADETNSFVVPLSYAQAGASYQAQTRRVQEATMLLGYSPGHLVDWADLEQGSGDLAVWPEEGIYPTEPIESMSAPGGSGCLAGTGSVCSTGGHTTLQVAPGVYRREFAQCYDQGSAFGPCAAIVNTTGNPVTVQAGWLTQSYGHRITFSGGDVQSGGTVNLTGAPFAAGSTAVPAQDAVLLAP